MATWAHRAGCRPDTSPRSSTRSMSYPRRNDVLPTCSTRTATSACSKACRLSTHSSSALRSTASIPLARNVAYPCPIDSMKAPIASSHQPSYHMLKTAPRLEPRPKRKHLMVGSTGLETSLCGHGRPRRSRPASSAPCGRYRPYLSLFRSSLRDPGLDVGSFRTDSERDDGLADRAASVGVGLGLGLGLGGVEHVLRLAPHSSAVAVELEAYYRVEG